MPKNKNAKAFKRNAASAGKRGQPKPMRGRLKFNARFVPASCGSPRYAAHRGQVLAL